MMRPTLRTLPVLVLLSLVAPSASVGQSAADQPGFRPLCTPYDSRDCWRLHEDSLMARWPDVAERQGDTLFIRLAEWGSLAVVDRPAPGDQTRMWAFRGVLEAHGLVLVDEERYLGHDLWLVNPRTGARQSLPCWIVPSPDQRWLYCGEGGWDEMGPSGSVAIYEMVEDSAVLRNEYALGPYQPVRATWEGEDRVKFQRIPLDGGEGTLPGCRSALDYDQGEWVYVECVR